MAWLRAIGISLLVGCAAVSAEESVWRKTQSNKQEPAGHANRPVSLGRPDAAPIPGFNTASGGGGGQFRRVRAQSPEDFALPPEYWSSTLGKESSGAKDAVGVKEIQVPTEPSDKKGETPKPAAEAAPAVFPASELPKVNVWTGLAGGGVLAQMDGCYQRGVEWLIPAGESFNPEHRLSVSAEYLLWWTRGATFPPLVAVDSPTAPEFVRGALPPAGTATVVFGGPQDPKLHSGARFGATYWLGDCGDWALEAGYFFLGEESDRFALGTDQFPVVSRPFINALDNTEGRQLVSTPGNQPGDFLSLRGTVSVDAPSALSGWDFGVRKRLGCGECWNVSGLLGYRQMFLEEGLHIIEDITSLRAVPGTNLLDPGNRIQVFDLFSTDNEFHGGHAGLRGEYRWNKFIFEGKAKIALGNNHQSVNVVGSQVITRLTGERQTFVGGLLALPTNIGVTSQNRFTVIPELGVKVGYQITDNLRVHAGYDFLYWSSVVRPGDQVERRINPLLVPGLIIPPQPFQGPLVPRVPLRTTDYWAQGVSFGVEWRY